MKPLLAFLILVVISINTNAQTNKKEIKTESEGCTINYFTKKDDVRLQLEKIRPQSELSKLETVTCQSKVQLIHERTVMERAEIFHTIYRLKNSAKFNKD